MEFAAITFDIIGKVMIAYTALRVHWRVRREHKIDMRVFREMQLEHVIGLLGIVFIVVGYLLEVYRILGA